MGRLAEGQQGEGQHAQARREPGQDEQGPQAGGRINNIVPLYGRIYIQGTIPNSIKQLTLPYH